MKLHRFEDSERLNQAFVQHIVSILSDAIQQRGHAYWVVSGGKTPISLFHMLAKTDLPWAKVTITLADERCVASTKADSNERLVKESLLKDFAAKARFIPLYHENMSDVETQLNVLPTFDIVILGMGDDGHTASLFPCSAEIKTALETDSSCILVTPKEAPYQRISLTKKRLLNSRNLFLHLVGENKWRTLDKALSDDDEQTMPIRAFLHQPKTELHVMYSPK